MEILCRWTSRRLKRAGPKQKYPSTKLSAWRRTSDSSSWSGRDWAPRSGRSWVANSARKRMGHRCGCARWSWCSWAWMDPKTDHRPRPSRNSGRCWKESNKLKKRPSENWKWINRLKNKNKILHQLRSLKARQIIWRSRRRNLIPKSKYLPTLICKKMTRNWRANSSIETTLKMKKTRSEIKNSNSNPQRKKTYFSERREQRTCAAMKEWNHTRK